MNKTQLQDRWLRKVVLTAQQGAVSTSDIVEIFLDPEVFNKVYSGMGSGNNNKALTLTADEVSKVSFALAAMANTFLDAARHFPKQVKREGE